MTVKTAILFDLDGTLLDTLQDLCDATNHTMAHFGCPLRTKEEIRSFVGNGAFNQIRLSLPENGTHPPVEEVHTYYQDYYNRTSTDGTAAPYPGVAEAMAILAKQYPLAIVSNKPDQAVQKLRDKYFPGIYARGVSTDCPRKPAPDMVKLTLQALGAENCIYVGDSEVDVATAKNAGVPCISVLWGFRDRQTLKEAGADTFCTNANDLPTIIDDMIKNM